MGETSLMAGAEPWAAEGSETGVLVLHGFTGTPQSVRPWAEGLTAACGATVIVPRLPGHGTDVGDLAATGRADWVGEAERAFLGLGGRCSTLFLAGLSMGATIALDLAARFADTVAGLMLVNPAVLTTDPRARLAPVLGRLPLRVKGVGGDIADPAEHELCYDRIPTRAAAELLKLQGEVRGRLGLVRAPLLVFASRQDHVVDPANASLVIERVASARTELVWLERSYHVATRDYDRDLIIGRSAAFVGAHGG